ncbi:AEC family transporter [Neptunomonas marina]|uniref:AEC family transporter n=1 Tax=Neptunomonas marina TaxID=1815562 RepID=A0A437Q9R3_9GAMM|nr:AEC family transporter [Neptunomonas marina]RVU31093.1 AEC family transporter [Neptunomonas marina]
MPDSLLAVLPLFVVIAVGYIAKQRVFDSQFLPGINQYVYFIAVPALLFQAASQQSLASLFNPAAWIAFVLGAALTAAVALLPLMLRGQMEREGLILRGLNSIFANYAYMGIPLSFAVLGDAAYGATVSIILAGNILLIGGAQLLIEATRQSGLNLLAVWQVIDRAMLRNPIFLATVAGLSVSYQQWTLPQVALDSLALIAPSAVPVALFCLGASLQFKRTALRIGEAIWLILIKLIIHPLLTLLACLLVGVNDPIWQMTMVLLTALPTGALAHVVAMKYQVFEKETSQLVVFSTVLSLFSVPIWLDVLS